MNNIFLKIALPIGITGSAFTLLLFAFIPLLKKGRAVFLKRALVVAGLLFVLPLPLLLGGGTAPRAQFAAHAAADPAYWAGQALTQAVQQPALSGAPGATQTGTLQFLPGILTGCYLAGALVFAAIQYSRHRVFAKALTQSLQPATPQTTALLQQLCNEMGIAQPPLLFQSFQVTSPILVGLAHPNIVLPAVSATPAQWRFALAHELTHYRHKDLLLKHFFLLVSVLNWYNPLLSLLRHAFADACEAACDEKLGRQMDGAQRREYAASLLAFSGTAAPYTTSGFALPAKQLKQRLHRILHPARPGRVLRAAAFALVGMVVCTGLLIGAGFSAGSAATVSASGPLEGSVSSPEAVSAPISPSTEVSEPTSSSSILPAAAPEGLAWPVPGASYSARGFVEGLHRGLDMSAEAGTPVYAAEQGTVVYSGWHFSYGYYVEIDHGDGLHTLYAHCSTLYVNTGDEISKGGLIAATGNSGLSTGPHCHFEVLVNGTPVDPYGYVAPPDNFIATPTSAAPAETTAQP
ncbi:MAG: M56 family metallopeptidase [Oscillospiraceae bacterium]